MRDRYYKKRRNCGVPHCFSGLKSRFAGQVLHKTTESWGTCLLFGTAEPVCRAGTAQNDRIVVYLPAFRDCRAGLRCRYYTERPNCGVPALGTCLGDGETGVPEIVCRAGTTKNDRIMGHLPAFRDCRAGLRGRYYTDRRYCGAPAFISGLLSRFEGQVLHRKAELWCTCLRHLPW